MPPAIPAPLQRQPITASIQQGPTLAITMADSALLIGETSLVTFTFSETPTGFTQGDVSVENGSLSGFTVTGDDKVYTATFTPTASVEDSSNIVSVGTGYTDAAGNTGTAATSANYTIDTIAPTVAISLSDTNLMVGESALITFTFSETPSGFTQGDVSVENGSLSGFTVTGDDKVYTATFTPTTDIIDASNIASVGTGYTDAAGNTGTAGTSANYSVDTVAPTVAITLADSALVIGESSLVTFTFSETPTGFTQGDVSVENGSLSGFTVTGDTKVYTATFTPTANIEDSTNIVSVGTGYTGATGNSGLAANSANYTIDTTAPTVVITMADAALIIGETSLVTFTFSETPTDFTQADVSVENGSLSGFTVTGDDKVYTATFTPTANIEDSSNIVSVGSAYTDAVGNTGTAATSANYTIDTIAPTVAITMADSALMAGETSLVTFTFSETPTGFTQGDVSVENGSLSGFTVTGDTKVYTATFTPTTNVLDASNSIDVGTGYTDAAGNTGTVGASANYTIDTIVPTVAITLADSELSIGETSLVTFTFSETPTGFTQGDISVENGSLSGFTVTGDDKVYTATFTPTASIEDSSNIVSVGTGYTGATGNAGATANSANYTIDTTAPTVAITMADAALIIGETSLVTFTFSETPTGFTQGDVSVENGSLSGFTVTGDDKVYTATFTPTANIEDSSNIVSVGTAYTDVVGNAGTAGTSVNYAIDTIAPTLAITMADAALMLGETSLVTFTFSETPSGFAQGDVTVENGSLSGFTVTGDDKVYTATFTPTTNVLDASNIISVGTGYTDVLGNTGIAAASANYTLDTIEPTVAITLADSTLTIGETSLVTFTFSETPTGFTQGDVSVENGSLSGFTVTGDDKVYTATFTPTANIDDSSNVVSVGTGYTGVTGNTGSVGTSANYVVDSLAPTVSSALVTGSSVGAGNALNPSDTVTMTVTMSENISLNTGGGNPSLDINIGGTTVTAAYVSSTANSIDFTYTVAAGMGDLDGISIDANSFSLNGATLADTLGNPATITHSATASNVNYKVNTAPDAVADSTYSTDITNTISNTNYTGTTLTVQKIEGSDSTSDTDKDPQITALGSSGAYVVVWNGKEAGGDESIYTQKFNADGTVDTSVGTNGVQKIESSDSTTKNDKTPQVTALGTTGAYVVVWNGKEDGGDESIYTQKFNADGTKDTSVGTNGIQKVEASDNTGDNDTLPQVTGLGTDGSYVVSWQGKDGNGDQSIFTQKFNTDGTKDSNGVQKIEGSDSIKDDDITPQIVALGTDGAYVVVWQGKEDGGDKSIYTQKFNADGTMDITVGVSGVQKIEGSDSTTKDDITPQVTALGSTGAYVVVWNGKEDGGDKSIYTQKFNADGTKDTTVGISGVQKIEASDSTGDDDTIPQVVSLGASGAYVVVWQGKAADESIYTQKFNADGTMDTTVGTNGVQKIEGPDTKNDITPQVTALGSTGAYVVVWNGKEDGGDESIYTQKFNADGTKDTSVGTNGVQKIEALDNTGDNDTLPQVTALGTDGSYVVSWQGKDDSGDQSIFTQKFNVDGTKTEIYTVGGTGDFDIASNLNPDPGEVEYYLVTYTTGNLEVTNGAVTTPYASGSQVPAAQWNNVKLIGATGADYDLQVTVSRYHFADEDTCLTIDVLDNDNDPEGSALSIDSFDTQVTLNAVVVGTVTEVTLDGKQQLKFTPNANMDAQVADGTTETLSFNYVLSDADGGTDGATVTFIVNGVTTPTLTTPLILDLDGDGIETTTLADGVQFDIDGDGQIDQTAWVGSDDAFLVRDINGDGKINGAAELFGSATVLSNGELAKDGFAALADLDSNSDGVINVMDALYDQLQTWQDQNQDGMVQDGELKFLKDIDVAELNLVATEGNDWDNGNLVGLNSSWSDSSDQQHELADVWLHYASGEGGSFVDFAADFTMPESEEQMILGGDLVEPDENSGNTVNPISDNSNSDSSTADYVAPVVGTGEVEVGPSNDPVL